MLALAKALEGTLEVVRFDFPYRVIGSGRPDAMPVLKKTIADVAAGKNAIIGGRSMGGRAASMLAADGFACRGLLLLAYPGISLMLVRSFCEHQAVENLGERTIIVEASPFWSLLFLNNNLHVAHHTRPRLAWYELPAYYRAERDALLAKNKGYRMAGYGEIFRRYFFRPKEPVAHPFTK